MIVKSLEEYAHGLDEAASDDFWGEPASAEFSLQATEARALAKRAKRQ